VYVAQILAVWWKGGTLHGLIRLLNTEAGQHAKRLLCTGYKLGASSRCWTSLETDAAAGAATVQEDCTLIT